MLIPVSSPTKPPEPNSGSRAHSCTVSHLHDPAGVSYESHCRADRAGHSPSGAYDLTTLEHFPSPLLALHHSNWLRSFQTSLRSGYEGRRIHLVSVRKVLLRTAGPGWHRSLGMWPHCLKQLLVLNLWWLSHVLHDPFTRLALDHQKTHTYITIHNSSEITVMN